MRIAVIGAGGVSDEYLQNLTQADVVTVAYLHDIDEQRATRQSERYNVPRAIHLADILDDQTIEVVVNLTPSLQHARVSTAALTAGKHVWTEKPLASNVADGARLLSLAASHSLTIRCAPETLLAPAFKYGLNAVRDGKIGKPVSALGLVQSPGPDRWHMNPEGFFSSGSGPLLDVGPYYVTALVQALGEVEKVYAKSTTARSRRQIKRGDRTGHNFPVEVPTTVHLLMTFEAGVVALLVLSWDSMIRRKGILEISGESGSLRFADPNTFSGSVEVINLDEESEIAQFDASDNTSLLGRGLGVTEYVRDLQNGKADSKSAEMGLYFLHIVEAAQESMKLDQSVMVDRYPTTLR